MLLEKFAFRTAAAAAVLFIAGCSLIPAYERPVPPVPASFPGAQPTDAVAPLAADVPWQDFFTDARLRRLIDIALTNNRDLRVSVGNIEQARAQFQIQRAAQFPQLGLSASGQRQRPSVSGNAVSQSFSVGLGVTAWELDFFGRIASLEEAALAQYLATEESRKATQISLIAAVANGWLTLLADDELLEITKQTLATRDESLRLTRLRFESGVASEIDARLAESLAETARASFAEQRRRRMQDENALVLLLGAPLPPEVMTGSERGLQALAPVPDLPAGLPSDLLTARPDIRAAEQQLLGANANIGAARAAFFPRISLTTSLGSTSREFSGLFDAGTRAWAFAPQITLPIFDAGRNQAGLAFSQAGRDIAVAQYERSIQSAFRDVADTLAGRATLGEQLRALRAQSEAESVRFRLADLRYRNGIASALDLLDAQRSLFSTQQTAVQVRLLQLQNQVLLYKALGGGWASR